MRTNLLTGTGRIGLALGVFGGLAVGCASGDDGAGANEAAATAVSCGPAQQAEAFTRMLNAPLKPPRSIAGVDLAGGDTWPGLTIDRAEQVLCQSKVLAPTDPKADDANASPTETAGWGVNDNNVMLVEYNKATRKVEWWQLMDGYKGKLEFVSRPTDSGDPTKPNPFGQHSYSIGLGQPVLRDGQPWTLNWKKSCADGDPDCWDKQATEMFDALMFTYAPELPSTQVSCIQAQTCLAKSFSTAEGIFGARPLGIYFVVPNVTLAQPAPSTPGYFYGFAVKSMPFSHADLRLKLDAEGSLATATNLGDRDQRASCTMKIGMPMQQFMSDCVEVMTDPNANALLRTKVLGGAERIVSGQGTAAIGTWLLDAAGPKPSFGSERFDETAPPASGRATEIALDIRSSGTVLNEYAADGRAFTFAATGAVYREYARLVQELLHAKMDATLPRHALGAPECLLPPVAPVGWHPAAGCTGMEQFVTPAEPSTTDDPNLKRVSIGAANGVRRGLRTVLKPGDPMAVFCADPETQNFCTGDGNGEGPLGSTGALFSSTKRFITTVLGGGNEAAIPAEARDINTYVRLFTKALVTYLRAAPQSPTTLHPQFDSLAPADGEISITSLGGGGDAVIVKYGTRFEYRVLTNSSNLQTMTFR